MGLLERVATIIEPFIAEAIVRNDPEYDPVLYTAIEGRVDVLCSRDRDLYTAEVNSFCRATTWGISGDSWCCPRGLTAGRSPACSGVSLKRAVAS